MFVLSKMRMIRDDIIVSRNDDEPIARSHCTASGFVSVCLVKAAMHENPIIYSKLSWGTVSLETRL